MIKYLLSCLTLLFFISCATEEKKPAVKNYSDDTNRAFEMIERGGSYYLKKAPRSAPTPQIAVPETPKRVVTPLAPAPEKNEAEIFTIDENINYKEKTQPTRPIVTPAPRKVDERLVEINQNLAFYCMKHRKDPAYGGNEEKCLKFVEKVQKNCQAKHRIVNSKLLSCIRTGLKKQ
jgi:hypothetical protein